MFPVYLSIGEGQVGFDKIYIGTISDISEEVKAREELIQAKEAAESANRQKSVFLNMMSHELRNAFNRYARLPADPEKARVTTG